MWRLCYLHSHILNELDLKTKVVWDYTKYAVQNGKKIIIIIIIIINDGY